MDNHTSDTSTVSRPTRSSRIATLFSTALMWSVVLQAVAAGRVLEGDDWARNLHRGFGGILLLTAVTGGVVSLVRLGNRAVGRRFGLMLIVIGIATYVEFHLGSAAADGEDTLWLHVPLGVALVALLAHATHLARRIDRERAD